MCIRRKRCVKELKEIERRERTDELKETGRIEAFSDGVFAVAITLLVLNYNGPKNLVHPHLPCSAVAPLIRRYL